MATRSEQYKAEAERDARAKRAKKKAGTKARPEGDHGSTNEHAAAKATYALEETSDGKRPSRKSTRKSANRSKPDASLNRVEEQRKSSSDSRFRKSKAAASKVRGKTPPR